MRKAEFNCFSSKNMKRLLPAVLSLSIIVSSCSSDGTKTYTPPDNTVTVLEYTPAPGQFINENMNGAQTAEQAVAWAQERIDGGLYVSLGAFGGYIVVRMGDGVNNVDGVYDFAVKGNAYATSNEPGIVWVSADTNGNGLADDVWYELKGSEFGNSETYRSNYSVTYTRTDQAGDVEWVDSDGNTGVVEHNIYHTQNYYPAWIDAGSYTLTGSLLAPNWEYNESKSQYENLAYGWGYADNFGEDAETTTAGYYTQNRFDIADAVDAERNAVQLAKIDFVKVQSAVLENVSILGEVSTEVLGFSKLNQ